MKSYNLEDTNQAVYLVIGVKLQEGYLSWSSCPYFEIVTFLIHYIFRINLYDLDSRLDYKLCFFVIRHKFMMGVRTHLQFCSL